MMLKFYFRSSENSIATIRKKIKKFNFGSMVDKTMFRFLNGDSYCKFF